MKSTNGSMALKYLKMGWSVFPIKPNKVPYVKWKKYQEKKPSETTVRNWWNRWPDANIAVATGQVSNLAVLDFDSNDALQHFEAVCEELPETITAHTAKGVHYYFRSNGLGTAAGFLEQTDLRGEGGLVVIPPSKHISGVTYQWNGIDPIEHGLDDLLDMPDTVHRFIQEKICKCEEKKNQPGWQSELLLGCKKGTRNANAAKLAGHYFRENPVDRDGNLLKLKDWNVRNDPPLETRELEAVINSIAEREGLHTFGNIIGFTVTDFKILDYPDGTVKYLMSVADVDQPLELVAGDFTSPIRFVNTFMDRAKRAIYNMPKKNDFLQAVDKLLLKSEIVEMDEEETALAVVREAIETSLNDTPEDPANDVDSWPIVYNDQIMLKLTTLMRNLSHDPEGKKFTRKQVVSYLRRMGFDNNNGKKTRIGHRNSSSRVLRIYKIAESYFRKKG